MLEDGRGYLKMWSELETARCAIEKSSDYKLRISMTGATPYQ